MICDGCGSMKGEECIDPYAREMSGEEVEMILCEDCYQNRVDDI